ncbi:SDR family oxidoreductase [Synechococcus sp. PCC 7336]|uniref:SDR family oxidoreductase n=1 Tax=Synechococcus sp. PCC 7336 TaxID=195250 RepID=UPI000345043D|nr:SDR family oxidoreductase [Synechococcus sp. PCC 7336]
MIENSSLARPALVTGASRGIGRAVAMQLAALGVPVVAIARDKAQLAEVVTEIEQSGGKAVAYAIDLTDLATLPERLDEIVEARGPFQITIVNAGMGYTADIADTPLQDWQTVLDLNLTAAFACIKAVLPGMRERRSGQIATVISIAGKQAFPGWGAYCASKFGLLGLSKALAQEESKHGIRVTAFCPGAVNSTLWDTPTVQADFDRTQMLDVETVASALIQTLSLPPNAVVDELVLMPSGGTF